MQDPSREVRKEVIQVLIRFCDRAIPAVNGLAGQVQEMESKEKDSEGLRKAKFNLETAREEFLRIYRYAASALDDEYRVIRRMWIEALPRYAACIDVLPVVLSMLNDPHDLVREAALRSLEELQQRAQSLGQLEGFRKRTAGSLSRLVELLGDYYTPVREAAVQVPGVAGKSVESFTGSSGDEWLRAFPRPGDPRSPHAKYWEALQRREEAGSEGEVPYGTGSWAEESLGNHRAVILVSKAADAVRVRVFWRRRDRNPGTRRVILIDGKTGEEIKNILPIVIQREYGLFVFQPVSGPGEYYLYFMPCTMTGRNYPRVDYLEHKSTSEKDWLEQCGFFSKEVAEKALARLHEAQVVEIQSIDEFSSFSPMEIIATKEETKNLLAQVPGSDYLLFPENRNYPIRMASDLPLRWIKAGLKRTFQGTASRGEFYAFQIGVYACRKSIKDLDVRFSDFRCKEPRAVIPASALRCFNLEGIDWRGKAFRKVCSVEKGKVRALWCGVQVPVDAPPGAYEGEVTIAPQELESSSIQILLRVEENAVENAGDSEPWRHSRLRWLDSTLALDDSVVASFTAMEVEGSTVSCLGRRVTLGKRGFPTSIESLFAPEMTRLLKEGREILSGPLQLVVEGADRTAIFWESEGLQIVNRAAGAVDWESRSRAGSLSMRCRASMEFDGYMGYEVEVSASTQTGVRDIRLEIPIRKNVARYMMGMGLKGGNRPDQFQWKWDPRKNQDAVWIGDVNAGLYCSLRAENYSRPLNTNFYLLKPLNMPPSWYNGGKGGCSFHEIDEETFLVQAYSGSRTLRPGEVLRFDFILLLTPFKTLDTEGQWRTRFYHGYKPIEEIAKSGANTINNHHGTGINPYINYPFLRAREMKVYVDEAHKRGMKVKIYYTVRELSNHAPELFALRSLEDEIFLYGPGGGYSWLQEHLDGEYIAGWFVPEYKDAALITSGVSRWHNYYVEGLNWLVKNVGIDGLYIDDVAFDRTIMKRVRKVLDRNRDGALIDLHSANQYNERDGFVNSALLYLEHFPYLNRLWFGEYFDYNEPPDFWLVEMSGIPFGLMGEMLQNGGNPWRGMVYGMTSRLPWAGDPTPLWKVWDEFGIQESDLMGYWAPSCPVKSGREDVLATAYVRKDRVLLALASWAKEPVQCRIEVDWDRLGMDREKARFRAPRIEAFQEEAIFLPTDAIPVDPARGWLLLLSEESGE